jgi:hypothetical protein
MFSINSVNEINSFDCKDRMNKKLKDEKNRLIDHNDQFVKNEK